MIGGERMKVSRHLWPMPKRWIVGLVKLRSAVDDTFYQFVGRTAARGAVAPAAYVKIMAALMERIELTLGHRCRW